MGKGLHLLCIRHGATIAPVQHDKIIAQPMHLYKGKLFCSGHSRAFPAGLSHALHLADFRLQIHVLRCWLYDQGYTIRWFFTPLVGVSILILAIFS